MKCRAKYGEFLTGKRIEKGYTLKQLSEISGIDVRQLTNIEKENQKGFSAHALRNYLKALNVSFSEIEE